MPLFSYFCAMKQLLLLLITILSVTTYAAEQPDSILVSGVVVDDADGTPLASCFIGTKVDNKHWDKTTIADNIGAFSIKIPVNSTLYFEYIGMQTEKIRLGDNDVCDLQIRLHYNCNILIDWVTLPTIELFVKDKDGNPISHALVAIINPKTDEVIVELGTTDACGYFYWFNNDTIKKGTYGLLVESEHREPKIAKINLKKKHSVIDIQLNDPVEL